MNPASIDYESQPFKGMTKIKGRYTRVGEVRSGQVTSHPRSLVFLIPPLTLFGLVHGQHWTQLIRLTALVGNKTIAVQTKVCSSGFVIWNLNLHHRLFCCCNRNCVTSVTNTDIITKYYMYISPNLSCHYLHLTSYYFINIIEQLKTD